MDIGSAGAGDLGACWRVVKRRIALGAFLLRLHIKFRVVKGKMTFQWKL